MKAITQNKKVKYILQLFIIIALIIASIFIYNRFNYTDAIKFKQEMEALNTEVNLEGNNTHISLHIPRNNRVKFLSFDELMTNLDKGTEIIFFANPADYWSRKLIPPMLEFASENKVNIYYYNVENENSENYQKILARLHNYLSIDTTNEDDVVLERIILPHMFFIKNGEVKAEQLFYEHQFLYNDEKQKIKDLLFVMLQKIK